MTTLKLFFLISIVTLQANAQSGNSFDSLAKKYISLKDYENGIIISKRGLAAEPENIELNKDLVLCYYFQNNFNQALSLLVKLINKNIADDQCYLIAGDIYKLLNEPKEAENTFRRGVLKFPDNGPMYNELGNLLWKQQKEDAITYWEKGIETDPNFSKNYFNAAGYYNFKKNWLWAALYAECFVNLESFSEKTPEVKEVLFNAYKNIIINTESDSFINNRPGFENRFLKTFANLQKNNYREIHTNDLIKIRAGFILKWFEESATEYPFKLFDYHRELLKNGLFESYNQWLFGIADNTATFKIWTEKNEADYHEFIHLKKSRIFKIPKSQYYK